MAKNFHPKIFSPTYSKTHFYAISRIYQKSNDKMTIRNILATCKVCYTVNQLNLTLKISITHTPFKIIMYLYLNRTKCKNQTKNLTPSRPKCSRVARNQKHQILFKANPSKNILWRLKQKSYDGLFKIVHRKTRKGAKQGRGNKSFSHE